MYVNSPIYSELIFQFNEKVDIFSGTPCGTYSYVKDSYRFNMIIIIIIIII